MKDGLVGVGGLVRLVLRRDRFLLPLWIGCLALLPVGIVSAAESVVSTAAERLDYAETVGASSTYIALYGPLYASSLGGIIAQRLGFLPVVVALISVLTVIRHTRTDEESGRRELLGSAVVGRHAALVAALIVTLAADLVLSVLVALALIGTGLPMAGSWALGLSFALSGWVFAGVAAVTAQLTQGAGAARGLAMTMLGVAYVLRLSGDLSGAGSGWSWLSALSPIGWARQIRAYEHERWPILAAAAMFAAVLAAAAVALSARRDVGAGVLAPRLGPAEAGGGLRGPFGLAWRLHRGLLAGWVTGFIALGLVLGAFAHSVVDIAKDNPSLADMFSRMGGQSALTDSYLAGIMRILALFAAAYAVQATLRLRTEETEQRAEPVLSTPVGRLRWAAGHLTFSALGPAMALAMAGLGAGLVHGLNTGDVGRELPRVLAGAVIQLPAVWLLAALAVALFGLLPRFAPVVAWAVLAVCLSLGVLGQALTLDQTVLDLSPFTHTPQVPGGVVSATPLIWLVGIATVLTAGGLAGLRRRDIPVG